MAITTSSFKICEILNIKPLDTFEIFNDLGEVCEGYIDEEGTFILTDEEQEPSDSGYWISYAINHPESVRKTNSELALLQYKYISYLREVFGVFDYLSINEEHDKITLFFSAYRNHHPGKEIVIDVYPAIITIYKMDRLIPYKQYDVREYWGNKYPKYNPDNQWCISLGLMEETPFKISYKEHVFEGYISNDQKLVFTYKDPHISTEELLNKLVNRDSDIVVTYLDEEGDYEFEY